MGLLPSDDAVLIQKGKKPGDPRVITVNCPDKTGLGCDICRTILDFGIFIVKGDLSTDGKWCYILLGLLHDVTHVLSDLELTTERVKVTVTPDGRVLYLFFITDNLNLLHKIERQEETRERLRTLLGESCLSCELQLADSPIESHQTVSISPAVSDELFRTVRSEKETHKHALGPELSRLKKSGVNVDNSLSPSHTLLQIECVDRKGLLYDILRTIKDHEIQIAYGRFSEVTKGERVIDLFVHSKDGRKIVDHEQVRQLCSWLKAEMLHPLRVMISSRGPDTELLVANPVELSGQGRPRVFYDATLALKALGICIFSAEIGRCSASGREWEVYRFLLDEDCEYELPSETARNYIVDKVRRMLMGW